MKDSFVALEKWLRWLERHPMYQKFVGLMPCRGTYLGCGFNPQSGCIQETTYQCFTLASMFLFLPSLSLFPSFPRPSSLSKINEHILS